MLKSFEPLVRARSFVGQTSAGKSTKGITQKEQLRVVKEFSTKRNDETGFNVLVCTCVAEEGLDIDDVDLIICFDSSRSPIRLIQRMGRTGRKTAGRMIALCSEGKEANVRN
jgi:Fanconi anemia group M protein